MQEFTQRGAHLSHAHLGLQEKADMVKGKGLNKGATPSALQTYSQAHCEHFKNIC